MASTTKKKGGADYDCWLLVESVRTARGPREWVVATIGKLPGHQWAMETGGSYILRTNWTESDPKTLWNTYIQGRGKQVP